MKFTYDNPNTSWQIYAMYNYSFSRSVVSELTRGEDGSVQRTGKTNIDRPSASLVTIGVALRLPGEGGVLLVK
jgi:hypothetical protein